MSLPAMLKLVAPLRQPKNPSRKSLNLYSPPPWHPDVPRASRAAA
jgi:hypothetical protein